MSAAQAPDVFDVYLSYSALAKEEMAPILERLRGAGLSLFDARGLPAGSDWESATREILRQARVLLFFVSEGPLGDGQEMELTQRLELPDPAIIPVVLSSAGPGQVPFRLRHLVRSDFRRDSDFDATCDELIRGIRVLIAKGGTTLQGTGSGEVRLGASAGPESAPLPPSAPAPVPPPVETPELSVRNASAGDQPTDVDTLGFEPYVDAMAGFLLNEETRPPLTVSIEGEWGSGKSSFMLQLEKALRARMDQRRGEWWKSLGSRLRAAWEGGWTGRWTRLRRASHLPASLTVRFNAWRHDKEDALWAAFALDFVAKIARQRFFLRRWWGHFRLFGLRYSWRTGGFHLARFLAAWAALLFLGVVLPLAIFRSQAGWSATVWAWLSEVALAPKDQTPPELFAKLGLGGVALYYAALSALLHKGKDFLGNPLAADLKKYLSTPDYAGRVAFVEAFHEDFERIVRAYVGDNKVFVFIDDLDRTEVPRAADLMQALNLMIAEDPHLVFLLGMDRKKVAAGLAVKHEKLLAYLAAPDLDGALEAGPELTKIQEAALAAQRGLDFGYEFLQKFIQLPFRVPAPRESDLRLFLGSLSGSNEAVSPPAEPEPQPAGLSDEGEFEIPGLFPRAANAPDHTPPPDPGRAQGSQPLVAPPPVAPPTETREEREERRRELRVSLGTDSAPVRDAGLMARQVLGGNPRRLKQFLNLFRLRCYIASETGLFSGDAERTVTLQQLAKLVALELAYPGFLFDLGEEPHLLASLQQAAFGEVVESTEQTASFRRWRGERPLLRLLQFGCLLRPGSGVPFSQSYSLEDLPVALLLQTSPRVERAAAARPAAIPPDSPVTASAAPAPPPGPRPARRRARPESK